jgi:hypothetical protein
MKNLPKNLLGRPFSWTEAKSSGMTQYALRQFLSSGIIERIARGVYRTTLDVDLSPEDQFKSALLRVGQPSAICLISALAFHHLTDVIPKKTWVMASAEKITNQKDIRVFRRRNPKWHIGIEIIDGLKITNVERTLLECLYYKDLAGGAAFAVSAIRLALNEKKTTMSDLLKMSKKLGVEKRILPYLEALS